MHYETFERRFILNAKNSSPRLEHAFLNKTIKPT